MRSIVWFRVRKDGNYVDVPPAAQEKSDSTLGWIPLASFPGDSTTVSDIISGIGEVSHGVTYDSVYLDESSSTAADNDESVDLDQYGLTQDNAIVLGVKKDDDNNTNDNGNDGNNGDGNGNDGNGGNGNDGNGNDGNGNDGNGNDGNDGNGNDGNDGNDGNGNDGNDGNGNNGNGSDSDDDDGRDYADGHPHTKGCA